MAAVTAEERLEWLELIDELDDEMDAAAMCIDLHLDPVDPTLEAMRNCLRDYCETDAAFASTNRRRLLALHLTAALLGKLLNLHFSLLGSRSLCNLAAAKACSVAPPLAW